MSHDLQTTNHGAAYIRKHFRGRRGVDNHGHMTNYHIVYERKIPEEILEYDDGK